MNGNSTLPCSLGPIGFAGEGPRKGRGCHDTTARCCRRCWRCPGRGRPGLAGISMWSSRKLATSTGNPRGNWRFAVISCTPTRSSPISGPRPHVQVRRRRRAGEADKPPAPGLAARTTGTLIRGQIEALSITDPSFMHDVFLPVIDCLAQTGLAVLQRRRASGDLRRGQSHPAPIDRRRPATRTHARFYAPPLIAARRRPARTARVSRVVKSASGGHRRR